jgi:hypothetical protein
MTMTPSFLPHGLSVGLVIISASCVSGCGASPESPAGQGASNLSASLADSAELLSGTWQYVPSASCGSNPYGAVNGNAISFGSGYYCSEGNGQAFSGFTFEQPVNVVAGGTYELALDLSNFNGWLGFIPSQLSATIAGVKQTAQATSGTSVVKLTFVLGDLPPGPPTITFTFRPPAAGIGPVNGGIFLTEEGCDVALSLEQKS